MNRPARRLDLSLLLGMASVLSCAGVGGPSAPSGTPGGSDASGRPMDAGAGRDEKPSDPMTGGNHDAAAADTTGGFDVGGAQIVFVYAHTSDKLYKVNPETLAVSLVGAFFKLGADMATQIPFFGVTDIAVDHSGAIIGVTFNEVLRIDHDTAACTTLAPLDGSHPFNGLSWVTQGTSEVLLGTTTSGTVSRIDPATGAVTNVGMFGQSLRSSGDLVSVTKFGTLVTVKTPTAQDDWLASLDPTTGQATLIGAIGFRDILGIGFWKDRVFGFAQGGQFILIDPATGAGTMVSQMPGVAWWGAGVTTAVFVVP